MVGTGRGSIGRRAVGCLADELTLKPDFVPDYETYFFAMERSNLVAWILTSISKSDDLQIVHGKETKEERNMDRKVRSESEFFKTRWIDLKFLNSHIHSNSLLPTVSLVHSYIQSHEYDFSGEERETVHVFKLFFEGPGPWHCRFTNWVKLLAQKAV